ncbi:unnamed protein product [Cladocopium goreaui]|uniref:Dolichyl-phosphate-mannose--protein mannosyltransferase n=1 Tax=Cladocopium goreaui TaxID=2562237 RepID=A0A9P1CFS9_9DINO|nr:unnamed protein product [Cladocopium goreaui]
MCKAAVLLWPALLTLLRWTRRNRGNRKNCNEGEKGNKGKNLLSSLLDLLYTEFLHWLVALYAAKCALEAATDTSLEYQSSAVQLQMLDNIFRASVSVYLYIWRMFTPLSVRCLPFHPVALGGLTSEHQICGAVAAASILGISGALVVLVWRAASGASVASAVLFFWVSYLVLLLPCLQLLQHGDPVWYADRYAYVPLALLLPPLVAWLLACLRGKRRLVAAAMVPMLWPVLAQQSTRSCECWRSGVKLWGTAADLLDWPAFHHQLGVSLLASTDLPRARQSLQRAWGQRQDALTAKAMARLVDATGGSPKKSLQWLRKALALAAAPGPPGLSMSQAAATYHDMAVLESRLERPNLPRILELYNQSLQLAPDRSLTQEHFGLALAVAGRHAEALVTLQAAQQLGRDSAELHNGLGAIWFAQKKWRRAQMEFERSLELRPSWTEAQENLLAVRKRREKQRERKGRELH